MLRNPFQAPLPVRLQGGTQYPGEEENFRREVEAEVTYQVRELAYHPSLAVWCGNNEIELVPHPTVIFGYSLRSLILASTL